jgi:hypothetical protein
MPAWKNKFKSPGDTGMGRDHFLKQAAKLGMIGALSQFLPGAPITNAAAATAPQQNKWHKCVKCFALFYDGYRTKGRCPAKGAHSAGESSDGDGYHLTYNSPGPGQPEWRYCNKCQSLFYNGYPQKGVCAAGGGHVAAGYNFTLRYDAKADGDKNFRYCNKCEVLYFEDFSKKTGLCAAGGPHVAAGYNFVLDFQHYTF